jgi:hypothetical protein
MSSLIQAESQKARADLRAVVPREIMIILCSTHETYHVEV